MRVLTKGLFFAAIGAFALLATDARADDKPAQGSWKKLAMRRFDIAQDAHVDAALADLPRLLRSFKPAGMKVTDLSVQNEGPRHLPRITFKATMHVDVDVGIAHVERDETVWVRGDVTARSGRCAYDPSRAGYEVKLDLSSSDEPVSANVSALVAAFCVDETANGPRHVELTSFMQVGPDYGTRVAGRLATEMLIKQTDPLVSAMRSTLLALAVPDAREASQ